MRYCISLFMYVEMTSNGFIVIFICTIDDERIIVGAPWIDLVSWGGGKPSPLAGQACFHNKHTTTGQISEMRSRL